ncbi:MAG: S8 family peptidase, partial [Acidobacteriota bacterium]|nr:S8 family peptidase [Acidobacteriota bacterium]
MRRLTIIGIILLLAGTLHAAPRKVSRDVDRGIADGNVDVIVQFKEHPRAEQLEEMRGKGAELKAELRSVRGALFSMPAAALEGLSHNPNVRYISPDRSLNGVLDYSLAAVGAEYAEKYGFDGSGIGIAVIDSGVFAHDDLVDPATNRSKVRYSRSLIGGSSGADPFGHGTHVAGILAAQGSSHGVAPGAHLFDLRALNPAGAGTDSSVIAAIDMAILYKDKLNIRVINLSLSRGIFESYELDPLCQAVEAAYEAGIVVVVSAGNSGRYDKDGRKGYGTIGSPGNDPYVITVGAMNAMGTFGRTDDLIASYSSKGPTAIDHVIKPDLVAPGNKVVSLNSPGSTLATNRPQKVVGGNRIEVSGTSMAAPVVAGAVALLLEQDPSLTPDQVKARLMKTASKAFPTTSTATDPVTGDSYTSQYDIFTVGAGYVDIAAALNNSETSSG